MQLKLGFRHYHEAPENQTTQLPTVQDGNTSLIAAILNGHVEAARVLMTSGANAAARTKASTAVQWPEAALQHSLPAPCLLQSGSTPLHFAAYGGLAPIVSALLSSPHVDVNAANDVRATHTATRVWCRDSRFCHYPAGRLHSAALGGGQRPCDRRESPPRRQARERERKDQRECMWRR